MEIKNRKAQHEFLFKQSFEAGIILDGAEVKSIREGNANINDALNKLRPGLPMTHSGRESYY